MIYPKCVKAITVCSSLIKSSISISPSAAIIFVFLSSPNFSLISNNSSLIIPYTNVSLDKISLKYGISIVYRLSDKVVEAISDAPTKLYFHHYRTVNAFIDRIALKCGLFLESQGYKYVPIPASQSVNGTQGIYSHKYAAVKSGLGTIGKSGLFISEKKGPRVRLGTILTDCKFDVPDIEPVSKCGECNLCVNACPAMAITGREWQKDAEREDIIDAIACSDYMKKAFQKIGRGAVCGICMKVCPMNK